MTQLELEIDLRVESGDWPDDCQAIAEKACALALSRADVDIDGPLELALLLTGDAEQQVINRDWRQIDKATNVLSFPQGAPFDPLLGPIGDLSFAFETVTREATDLGKPFADHFTHLLVHGTLHLVGYDHQTEDEALVMESLETEILAEMGIADPYAD